MHAHISSSARIRFPEMTPAIEKFAKKSRIDVLQGLGLKEEGTKLKILMELSEAGRANVYELWKRLPDVGHYSTVLRALKILWQKNLVEVVSSSIEGRMKKIYALTLLGKLISRLVKGGWRSAAQLLAESSSSFRECIRAHFSRDPYRYWPLTRDIIKKVKPYLIISIPSPEIEEIVRSIEIEWAKVYFGEQFDDPESRAWISKYLKKMAHVSWIRSELLPFMDSYIEEERTRAREWLQVLDGFKSDLLSVEKCAKLTDFLTEKEGGKV